MAKRKRSNSKAKKPKTILVCKITGEIPLDGEEDFHLLHEVQSILENIRGYGTAVLEFEARSG